MTRHMFMRVSGAVLLVIIVSIILLGSHPSSLIANERSTPTAPLISDQQFVFHPDLFDFDIAAYLNAKGSGLAGYSEIVDGKEQTAIESIEFTAHMYSINPKVFLTLLEMHTGAVTSASLDTSTIDHAFGYSRTGLQAQLDTMAQTLVQSYYGFKWEDSVRRNWPPEINAGTAAIAALLESTLPTEQMRNLALTREPESFFSTFDFLFGDPLAGDFVNQQPSAPLPGARLPWLPRETWNYNSGPHNNFGGAYNPPCPWGSDACRGPWSALDFGTMRVVGCNPNSTADDDKYTDDWVVAVRDGDVAYANEKGSVKINHRDGWITYYVHLSQVDLIPVGTNTTVQQGDKLGHPSCQGNTSGIHLHFSVNYNGEFQPANGTNLGGWTVVQSNYHYNGKMTCPDGREKTASTARYETSKITDDCRPSQSAALSVVLIIDSTGSMASNDPRRLRVEAAKAFIDASQIGDEIGIVDFQTSGRILAPMTIINSDADKATLKNAVNAVFNGGLTNINAGLNTGFTVLSAAAGTGQDRAAILLTDGGHNVGPYDNRSHMQYADKGWPVYTVGLGQPDLVLLARIATQTGGECVNNCMALTDAGDLGLLYQAMRARLTSSNPVTNQQIQIQQGQQRSVPASVSPNQFSSQFYIGWDTGEMDLVLFAPGGLIIDPDNLPPNVRHAKGSTYELYHVDFPQAGQWTMSVFGKTVTQGRAAVNVYASSLGPSYLFQPMSIGFPPVTFTPTPPLPTLTPLPAITPTTTPSPTPTIDPTPSVTAVPGWHEVSPGSASGGGISNNTGASQNVAMAAGSNNDLFIAWNDASSGDAEIYLKKWNGVSWSELGGSASGGGISNNSGQSLWPSLAIGGDGNPWVAWHDTSAGKADIYIKRWTGSGWDTVGSGSASGGGISNSAGDSTYVDLKIAANGTAFATWVDDTAGNDEIYVKQWDGVSWNALAGSASGGGISNSANRSGRPAIALNGNLPTIAWAETGTVDNIFALRFNGSAWVEVGAGSASGGGLSNTAGRSQYATIDYSPSGNPHIAWYDDTGGQWEIYVKTLQGTSWIADGTGAASGGGISNTPGVSREPNLIAASSGVFVAWQETVGSDNEIYIRRLSGNSWVEVDTGSASGGGISNNTGNSNFPVLASSPNGNLYLAWDDNSAGDYEIYVLVNANP